MAPRILVVDDNVALAENLREVLRASGLGVEVTIAESAAAAIELSRARPFDVAIIDLMLPDGSGVDLMAPLRAAVPGIEIVLLTGNATVESAIAALRAGAAGFILKSLGPEDLIVTVEQALSRAALRRERERYEKRYVAIANAADVLIVGLDLDGAVVFFNPMLSEIVGASEGDAIGKPFSECWVDPAERRRFDQAMEDARAGEAASELEVGLIGKDGAARRVRFHLSLVRGEVDGRRGPGRADETDHLLGIGVDVTARRALERRAASAEAMNAMAPLALGLAHEIRNPLNAAVLELHLLGRAIDRIDDAAVKEPMRRRVTIVEGEIRRLERLLTEFLELARPRAPQRECVDLSAVVESVLDLERVAIKRSNVSLTRALGAGAMVIGDTEKLKQAILNLVVNALDVMPEGGTLDAKVTGGGDDVVFALKDSGKGIEPKDLAEVFDPFFTTKPAGTGLGLAIVRKVVEQHGGRVVLRSAPGEGTTVEITLPAAPGKA